MCGDLELHNVIDIQIYGDKNVIECELFNMTCIHFPQKAGVKTLYFHLQGIDVTQPCITVHANISTQQ